MVGSFNCDSIRYPLNEELDSVHSYLAFSPLEQLHPYLLDGEVMYMSSPIRVKYYLPVVE